MGHLAKKRLCSAVLVIVLLAPVAARANGFALDIQGLFSNGTASAGAASAHDPAGQFANPAILASLEGTQFVAGGMLIAAGGLYTDSGSTMLDGAAPLPGNNGDGAQTGIAPWVFASHRLSRDWAVGFSLTAPFGLATDYGRNSGFYGRYHGVESRIESIAFGPAVAWRPTDGLALGLRVAARRDKVVIGQAFDRGSICVGQAAAAGDPDPIGTCTASGLTPGASDAYGRFDADGWGWTLAAGATVDVATGTTFGIGYRHESKSTVKGRQSFDAEGQAFFGITGEPNASLDLPLPDFLTVSVSQRLSPSLALLGAFQYTFWSRFDTINLVPDNTANGLPLAAKQGYRDAFRVSGAVVWTVQPGIDLFSGIAFELSPLTDQYRDTNLAERDTIIAGIGAEATVWRGLTAGAAYQRCQMIGTSRIDRAGDTGDRLIGNVRGYSNVVVLQIGWRN